MSAAAIEGSEELPLTSVFTSSFLWAHRRSSITLQQTRKSVSAFWNLDFKLYKARRQTALPLGSLPFDVFTRLCYAFRLSQPLDVLFRSRRLGLVSCRIRPWGLDSQRFPPPCSRHGLHRELSLCLEYRPLRSLPLSIPKNEDRRHPQWILLGSCSEERLLRQTR